MFGSLNLNWQRPSSTIKVFISCFYQKAYTEALVGVSESQLSVKFVCHFSARLTVKILADSQLSVNPIKTLQILFWIHSELDIP